MIDSVVATFSLAICTRKYHSANAKQQARGKRKNHVFLTASSTCERCMAHFADWRYYAFFLASLLKIGALQWNEITWEIDSSRSGFLLVDSIWKSPMLDSFCHRTQSIGWTNYMMLKNSTAILAITGCNISTLPCVTIVYLNYFLFLYYYYLFEKTPHPSSVAQMLQVMLRFCELLHSLMDILAVCKWFDMLLFLIMLTSSSICCRELEEKKAQKRLEEAQQTWAQLLKAIFLRLGFQENEPAQSKTK